MSLLIALDDTKYVWIKTFYVSRWLLFLCLPHLDQYYQCSSHLAPTAQPGQPGTHIPNMTAQCSPPPSQHLQYLLTLDMQLISLLYHWLFTSLHIFAWGLEKTQSSICTDSFCKIYQLSMACYQFLFDRRDLYPNNSLHHHISTNMGEMIWKSQTRRVKLKIHTAAPVWLGFSHSNHIWLYTIV